MKKEKRKCVVMDGSSSMSREERKMARILESIERMEQKSTTGSSKVDKKGNGFLIKTTTSNASSSSTNMASSSSSSHPTICMKKKTPKSARMRPPAVVTKMCTTEDSSSQNHHRKSPLDRTQQHDDDDDDEDTTVQQHMPLTTSHLNARNSTSNNSRRNKRRFSQETGNPKKKVQKRNLPPKKKWLQQWRHHLLQHPNLDDTLTNRTIPIIEMINDDTIMDVDATIVLPASTPSSTLSETLVETVGLLLHDCVNQIVDLNTLENSYMSPVPVQGSTGSWSVNPALAPRRGRNGWSNSILHEEQLKLAINNELVIEQSTDLTLENTIKMGQVSLEKERTMSLDDRTMLSLEKESIFLSGTLVLGKNVTKELMAQDDAAPPLQKNDDTMLLENEKSLSMPMLLPDPTPIALEIKDKGCDQEADLEITKVVPVPLALPAELSLHGLPLDTPQVK